MKLKIFDMIYLIALNEGHKNRCQPATKDQKEWYTYDVHENCQIFKTPHPPCPSTSKILPLPWSWTSNFNPLPPTTPTTNSFQMLINQSKENIIQGWLSDPSFRSALVFSINSLVSSGFSLTSFHLAEALLSAFLCIYTLLCAVVEKDDEMSFIYNYLRF